LHRHTAGSRASTKSIHRLSAVAPPPISLLSTSPAPAGVTPETSRSIKPRERDLRDLRLLFWLGFLRGQRTILDMPSALQTSSRSQYAPVNCGKSNITHRLGSRNGNAADWTTPGTHRKLLLMPVLRWNFSTRAGELSGGDAVVVSIPKSGRTWVRTFLSAYFSHKAGSGFRIDFTEGRTGETPRIIYSHDRFENLTKGSSWDRWRGKYLIPPSQLRRAPIVVLARDPRDAFVSYFVQLTRRNPATPDAIKRLTADALLRNPRFGVRVMVDVMNRWIDEFRGRPDFEIVRYEDLQADTRESFSRLLNGIGIRVINSASFEHALDFANFENMQRLEASGAFGTKILQPRNVEDPESFKVRRGKVGGFRDYLSPQSQEYASRICATLDPAFGYPIQDAAAK
jgi:hypothetical protein